MTRELTLFVDGATRKGNPGQSGYGAVLYSSNGHDPQQVAQCNGYLGDKVTNNQAEYCALLAGLELASEHRKPGEALGVYSDSLLVLKQLEGVWVQNSRLLRNLWTAARARTVELRRDGEVWFKHVPGHAGVVGNELADQLAGEAVEQRVKAPEWVCELARQGAECSELLQGHEQLRELVLNWFKQERIPAFVLPRVFETHQRAALKRVNDVGARSLLYAPEIIVTLPGVGTCLIALATRFIPRRIDPIPRVMPKEGLAALQRWEATGCPVLVVHKPYGSGRWRTEAEMNWGSEDREAPAACAFLRDIKSVGRGVPLAGWSATVELRAEWGSFIPEMKKLFHG